MKENTIPIRLFEREFLVKTKEPPEKIEKITNFVNEYLSGIQKQKQFKDRLSLSLLATFNIALEYSDLKENYENLTKKLDHKITYLINLIDNFWDKNSCGVRD